MEGTDDAVLATAVPRRRGKLGAPTSRKLTHVHMQEKYLRKIPKLADGQHVVAMYLYSNEIDTIDNLSSLKNLQSLYLQKNRIEKMENLKQLKKLKRLYLGHNNISILEGLECLEELQELYLEKQYLPDKISLCMDPRSINTLSRSLRVLNISHNNITNLCDLSLLKRLVVINAGHNRLDDIREVCETLRNWCELKEATFSGNGITKIRRYRVDIIASSNCLEMLDDKTVSENSRTFIKRFEEGKLVSGSKPSINLSEIFSDLPKNYPPSLQKAVSASILKSPGSARSRLLENDLSTFDEKNAVYIAWNALPQTRPSVHVSRTVKKRVINEFPKIAKF